MKTTYEEGQTDSETFYIRHTTTFTKSEWLNREVMVRGLFENKVLTSEMTIRNDKCLMGGYVESKIPHDEFATNKNEETTDFNQAARLYGLPEED